MNSRKPVQSGYSLIEVLVAFVILALTLGILFRIFSAGLRNIDTSSDYTSAVVIAESRLASPGIIEPLEPGRQQGTDADRYSWVRTISPFGSNGQRALSTPTLPAYRIDVAVRWSRSGKDREIMLSTIRLDNTAVNR